jgi:Flp pilus assembly protein TadD
MGVPGLLRIIAVFAASLTVLLAQTATDLYKSGIHLIGAGQSASALMPLRRAVELDPNFAAAWKALGVAYASQRDIEHAEAAFRNACVRAPSVEDACLYYGRALYLLDRFEPAIGVLRRAIALRDQAEGHRLVALSLEGLGRTEEAGEEFRAAVRMAGRGAADEDPGIDYGVFLFRQGQSENALTPIDAALARHPDSARAHLEKGCVLLALDRLNDAATELERALAIQPSPRAHLLLGKVYLRLGRNAEAEAQLKEAR